MAVATVSRINYAILGAPRYQHKGQVVVVVDSNIQLTYTVDSPKVVMSFVPHNEYQNHT